MFDCDYFINLSQIIAAKRSENYEVNVYVNVMLKLLC